MGKRDVRSQAWGTGEWDVRLSGKRRGQPRAITGAHMIVKCVQSVHTVGKLAGVGKLAKVGVAGATPTLPLPYQKHGKPRSGHTQFGHNAPPMPLGVVHNVNVMWTGLVCSNAGWHLRMVS